MYREQFINNHIDRLELFIKFEDVHTILRKEFEEERIDALSRQRLLFFALTNSISFDKFLFASDNAES